jgi:hypothetical protein
VCIIEDMAFSSPPLLHMSMHICIDFMQPSMQQQQVKKVILQNMLSDLLAMLRHESIIFFIMSIISRQPFISISKFVFIFSPKVFGYLPGSRAIHTHSTQHRAKSSGIFFR